jgi:hypothetical protein
MFHTEIYEGIALISRYNAVCDSVTEAVKASTGLNWFIIVFSAWVR